MLKIHINSDFPKKKQHARRAMGWQSIIIALVLALGLWGGSPAIAQTETAPLPRSTPTAIPFWEQLQQLSADTQLQRLLEEDMRKSIAIREQIQTEVDRAFSHTTTLLNVLLVVLTTIPVLAAIGIWFIRRSVVNQVIAETRRQVQEEVEKQLAADVTVEFKRQTVTLQHEIEILKQQFEDQLSQLKSLFLDAQQAKDMIIQELAQIMPSPLPDATSPETQQKIQSLTRQLELLTSAHRPLSFTANDYIEQGRAFYFEGRYAEAIAAQDRALNLEPENAKAWFSRGATLAKLQQYEEALQSYTRALQIKPDFSEAWFGQGSALTKLQQYDAAIAAYDKATVLKPDFYLAWVNKARCYSLKSQRESTIASLKQAMLLNPDKTKEVIKNDTAFEALRDVEIVG